MDAKQRRIRQHESAFKAPRTACACCFGDLIGQPGRALNFVRIFLGLNRG